MSKLYHILTCAEKNQHTFNCILESTGSWKFDSTKTGTSDLNNRSNVPFYQNFIYSVIIQVNLSTRVLQWSQVPKLSFDTTNNQIYPQLTKLQLCVGTILFKICTHVLYFLSDRAWISGSIPITALNLLYWLLLGLISFYDQL